jgi:glycylpeptide N-tetradecanoyltransferase
VKGIREMTKEDVPKVFALMTKYLKRFPIHIAFTEERLEHTFMPIKGVMYSYVVENEEKQITDFISFYYLSYSVLTHPTIKEYKVNFRHNIRASIFTIMHIQRHHYRNS